MLIFLNRITENIGLTASKLFVIDRKVILSVSITYFIITLISIIYDDMLVSIIYDMLISTIYDMLISVVYDVLIIRNAFDCIY